MEECDIGASSGTGTLDNESVKTELLVVTPSIDKIPTELSINVPSSSTGLLNFPPKIIPFRSASFSQVDVTSDGKYVRNNSKSSITLKPTAFCLNNTKNKPLLESPDMEEEPPFIVESNDKLLPEVLPVTKQQEFPIVSHAHSKSCPGVIMENPVVPVPTKPKRPPRYGGDGYEAERESLDLDDGEEKVVSFTLGGDDEPIRKLDFPITRRNENDGTNLKRLVLMGPYPTTDSTTSTSGGEAEDDLGEKALIRQSSGQSDGSDELPPLAPLSDASGSSPPPSGVTNRDSHSHSISSTLKLGSSGDSSGSESGKLSSISTTSSVPSAFGRSDFNRKELISRAQSINSSLGTNRTLPSGRFYKRPLRGPYGEMLEAEMNKLIPSRASVEPIDFFRESKSSSPGGLEEGEISALREIPSSKLSSMSSLLMASMDDLNLSTKQPKHFTNPRNRKISTNIAMQGNYSEGGGLGFHQRTASSPSELLYSTNSTTPVTETSVDGGSIRRKLDGSPRGHVLAELVETERSYVDSLRTLAKKYMEPLKSSDFIEDDLVDEIFFQVPTILWHHERLLDALQKRVVDDMQSVGDVLLDAFRQNSLLECYSLFVRNWKSAKGSLKMALASKPSLGRFLESNARQHKGKLNLDSLLIMPIQRIPRYELLVKELLKYTQPIHDDHSRLILLSEKIKEFALHIDCASVDPNDSRDVEIEGWGAGLGHLVRQDILPVFFNNSRKERAVFLFADSLLIASIKRKGTRKPSSNPNFQSNWEGCKLKLILKAGLGDVKLVNEEFREVVKSGGSGDEVDDLRTIRQIMELASSLRCPHGGLDDVLKDMLAATKNTGGDESVEIQIKNIDGSDTPDWIKIMFGTLEKKNAWLETFNHTMAKFLRYGVGRSQQLQFVQALPIRKTRAGLLLSCAAPVSLHNRISKGEFSDVWVANSDGYVGQVCILTLHPEPSITSCNGVCNSRITCMKAIPPPDHPPHSSSEPPHTQDTHYEEEEYKIRISHKEHWSVWLGTEDGGLHIYDCVDSSIRVKKNRHKIQLKAPLNTITYYDGRVFVALGNGDVVVYTRNTYGKGWATGDPSWVTIGSAMAPVTKMLCVGREVWCACGNILKVYGDNGGMLELVQSIQVTSDGDPSPNSKAITAMVTCEDWVWVAVGSSIIKAYANNTFELLHEVNVGPSVAKILAGCDDIIRQHKTACLRVTALYSSANKFLWIGTSAGVILTLAPANSLDCKLTPLSYGHTGQVRFLTSCVNRDSWTVISGGDGFEEFKLTSEKLFFRSSTPTPSYNNNTTSFSSIVTSLIPSGSDGREDSTNHLLIWKIPKQS